jgi:hypothetical protein
MIIAIRFRVDRDKVWLPERPTPILHRTVALARSAAAPSSIGPVPPVNREENVSLAQAPVEDPEAAVAAQV